MGTEHTRMRNIPYAIVFACAECDFGTLDENTLKSHMLNVHQHEVMNAQLPAEPMGVFQSAQSMHVQSNKTAKINSKPLNAPRIQVPKSKCKSCIFETTSEFDLL